MHIHPGLGYSIRWWFRMVSGGVLNLMLTTFDKTNTSHYEQILTSFSNFSAYEL